MELNEQELELLDAYETGIMPEDERRRFEARMTDEPEFGKAVRQLLALNDALFAQTDARVRQYLEAQQAERQKTKRFKIFYARITALAAICLIGFGAWKFFYSPPPPTPEVQKKEVLIATAFEHLSAPSTMSAEKPAKEKSGIDLYKEKQYGKAIHLLEQAYSTNHDIQLLFFKGVACVGDGQPQKAIEALEICRQDTTDIIPQQDNDWYLLLAYLAANDSLKSGAAFNRISADTSHKYYQKAKELQAKLQNLKN